MAQTCKATGGAGLSHTKGYEDAVNARISGEVNGKEQYPEEERGYPNILQKLTPTCQTISRTGLSVCSKLLSVRSILSRMP